MSDISNCKNVSDHTVSVTVHLSCVLFDIIKYHLALKFSTLISIESYIICIIVEAECFFVKLSC